MKNKIFRSLVLPAMVFFWLAGHNPLGAGDNSFKWQIGEELTYKVKWSLVRLGTLKLQILDTLTIDNIRAYQARLFMDSNPVLFFVNMHSVYETIFDEKYQLILFRANEKIDNVTYNTEYRFDYQDSLIHINMTDIKDTSKVIIRTEPLNESIIDGTAMIFYARAHCATVRTDTLVAFFEAKRGKVAINFKSRAEKIKISALPESVPSYFLDGEVKMKGIAGLTGPFKGWFAGPPSHPPLKAQLKVFIGNVNVELENWKNWQPSLSD